jgi:hypothetical protein
MAFGCATGALVAGATHALSLVSGRAMPHPPVGEGAGAGRAKPVGHYSEARKTRIGSSIEAFEAITKDAVSPRIWKPRAWERSAGQARLAQTIALRHDDASPQNGGCGDRIMMGA